MARILVVDDDPHMREVLELVLADGNRAVDSVGSGEAALERLARQAYDLVVCDLQLSDLDGVSVYDAIAEDNASAGGGQAVRSTSIASMRAGRIFKTGLCGVDGMSPRPRWRASFVLPAAGRRRACGLSGGARAGLRGLSGKARVTLGRRAHAQVAQAEAAALSRGRAWMGA
jgi:CheY-like chemotaxis protein